MVRGTDEKVPRDFGRSGVGGYGSFQNRTQEIAKWSDCGGFSRRGTAGGSNLRAGGARIKEGISLLAAQSGCSVRPAVIVGSDQLYVARNWLRRPRVVVAVGEPIPALSKKESRKEWVEKLASEMRKLYAEVRERHRLEEVVLPKTPQERWKAGR